MAQAAPFFSVLVLKPNREAWRHPYFSSVQVVRLCLAVLLSGVFGQQSLTRCPLPFPLSSSTFPLFLPPPCHRFLQTCRLLHALLLGRVRSLPTLDDLRSMRRAISLKASTASRASIGEALGRSPAAKGTDNTATVASPAVQAPTLRIAQRHLSGIPFWFERQEHEAERGGERAGSDGCSSTIRAVYAEAWGGDDGRVDGLDLLLTLCAVPGDAVTDDSSAEDDDGEEKSDKPHVFLWVD